MMYIFKAGTNKVIEIRDPRSRLPWPDETDRKTLYIVDAGGKGIVREPERIDAFTVCLASPNEKHYGQFAKDQGVFTLMMPPWEWDEIKAIAPYAAASLPGVKSDQVLKVLKDRYNQVGGVLRSLFMDETKFKPKVSAMKAALMNLTSEQLQLIRLKDQYWHRVPNDVFVLKSEAPDYDLLSCSVDLASEYLRSLAKTDLRANKRRDLLSALAALAPYKDEYGSYPGHVLADAFKEVFANGGSFSIRNLADKKTVSTLVLPPLLPAHPQPWTLKELDKVNLDTLYVLAKPNYEHIDGFFMHGDVLYLLQFTTSASREFPPLKSSQEENSQESSQEESSQEESPQKSSQEESSQKNSQEKSKVPPGLERLVSDMVVKIDKPNLPRQIRFVYVVDGSVFHTFQLRKAPSVKPALKPRARTSPAPTAIAGIPLTVEVLSLPPR